jgi:hypothetical protein
VSTLNSDSFLNLRPQGIILAGARDYFKLFHLIEQARFQRWTDEKASDASNQEDIANLPEELGFSSDSQAQLRYCSQDAVLIDDLNSAVPFKDGDRVTL